jgi:predicted phosphodiesterase
VQIAVISDPHGDLVALRAVVADLEGRRLDEVLVAGDLAQGGPHPVEVLDMLFAAGWPMVRGNSDDFLIDLAWGRDLQFDASNELVARGHWSVARLGQERIERLAALPMEVRRPWPPNGPLVVVHATPWSTEEVVLSDAPEEVANRMVTAASAGVLAYGHIHSAYQRRVESAVLLSAGAISGSNDADIRPAYTILTLDQAVKVEVIRVECPIGPRLDAFAQAGVELTEKDLERLIQPGLWPVCGEAGEVIQLWP